MSTEQRLFQTTDSDIKIFICNRLAGQYNFDYSSFNEIGLTRIAFKVGKQWYTGTAHKKAPSYVYYPNEIFDTKEHKNKGEAVKQCLTHQGLGQVLSWYTREKLIREKAFKPWKA